jgi:hypothetical protein
VAGSFEVKALKRQEVYERIRLRFTLCGLT